MSNCGKSLYITTDISSTKRQYKCKDVDISESSSNISYSDLDKSTSRESLEYSILGNKRDSCMFLP